MNWLRQQLTKFAVVLRFGAVGIVATLTYLAIAAGLSMSTRLDPLWINVIANAIGVVVSYVGHHAFTYSMQGGHTFYAPKFVVVTLCLFGMSSGVTYLSTRWGGLSGAQAALVVSLLYPPSSFLLQHFWTFSSGRAREPDAP